MKFNFWKDKEKGLIEPELFSETARSLAERVFSDKKKANANNPTQLRKFYDEILRFEGMVKKEPGEFERLLPYLKLLNAKVTYAEARELVSQAFREFISTSIAQVHDSKDLEVFSNLFEAFMGFYKYNYERGKKREKDKGQDDRNRRAR